MNFRNIAYFTIAFGLIIFTGFTSSWNVALAILNMSLISAILALGVNIQWGYAGLFNIGIMGFVALGGVAAVIVAMPPIKETWDAGGLNILGALCIGIGTVIFTIYARKLIKHKSYRSLATVGILFIGFFLFRTVFDAGVAAIESVNPASTGYLGGLGLPILLAWPIGGLIAAGAAWLIGKVALGLRSDYLAVATLGIAEIILAVIKNEDWLTRGVKNVIGIPRPVAYEIDLQESTRFLSWSHDFGIDPVLASSLAVKFSYTCLFATVLLILIWMTERALKSPWGRMIRAIRDNETAAKAMGKDVTKRHLQIFILGSAICGIAGAMLVTLDGQLTPNAYQPLRFTFLIWVMVIIGGSGNNWGSVLGGIFIWYFWIQVEPMGNWFMQTITAGLEDGSALKIHLLASAAHMRLVTMGIILLLVLRFSPKGLIPEK